MELVLDLVRRETNDIIVIEIRIGEKDAIGFDALLGVLDQQAPVRGEFIQAAQAEPLIVRIIDVVFDDRAIVGRDEVDVREVSACLKAFTVGRNRNAIVTYRTSSAETGRLFNAQRAADIVDIAALAVIIDHSTQGELVGDRDVDERLGAIAHLAAIGERGRGLEPGIKAGKAWLVSDEAHGARL